MGPCCAPIQTCSAEGVLRRQRSSADSGLADGRIVKQKRVMAHNDNRKHNFSVSFSDEEYALFLQRVEDSGLTKSKFAREVLLKGSARNSKDFIKTLNTEIKPLGRNLRSAFLAVNQNGCNPQTIAKLEHSLDVFEIFIQKFLQKMD